jgi:glycerophosphoryl diester phosphodiesterase
MRSHFNPILAPYALMVLISFSASSLDAVEIIAHRGASYDAPENTVVSFMLGWQQQADAGELDIHLTKDRQVVVIHDADTKRTTGTSGPVASRTLAELRTLDAGSWKGPQWRGEKLPTLSEALKTVPEGKRMFIEIKCGLEVIPIMEGVLQASGKKPEQLVLIGFNYATMAKAKQRFPGLAVHWVVSYEKDKKTGQHPDLDTLIARARAARFDGLDLDYKFPINSEFVAKIKESGLQLYVWTVDDATVAAKLVAADVHGIETNRPGWLRKQLK